MSNADLMDIATTLWTLIRDGKCIAWVGSGLSAPAGYPEWQTTIDALCRVCDVTPLSPGEQSAQLLMKKAKECKTANPNLYCATLADLFGRPVAVTRQAFNLLMRIPFKGYITTNFDPLLAWAGSLHDCHNLRVYPVLPPMELGGDSRPIFYLHGLARQGSASIGEHLILAEDDFETAYSGNIRMLLDPILTYFSLIFIGCSLTEPLIHESFRRVRDILLQIEQTHPHVERPQRYALLPSRYRNVGENIGRERAERDVDRERDEEKRFSELTIAVLRYDPHDESQHYEIEQILELLCRFAERPISLTPRIGFGQEFPT